MQHQTADSASPSCPGRRHGLLALAGWAAASSAHAQSPASRAAAPRDKGPIVVDDMDQQDLGWRIDLQADQVRRALLWVHRHAADFGGDPARIFVSGHSSGAELAAMALTTDWPADFGATADLLQGGLCCSAVYDLRAFRRSAAGARFAFSDDSELATSALRQVERIRAPLIVAVGSFETTHFKRQTLAFADALRRAGKPVQVLVAEGYNHFEVIETLANPHGLLGRAALAQMGLGPP